MSPASAVRHYAGVLVSGEPSRFAAILARLATIAGAEVHHVDPATGRCVVVLESADRAGNERLFVELGQLPAVRGVDLVYHLVDNGEGVPPDKKELR